MVLKEHEDLIKGFLEEMLNDKEGWDKDFIGKNLAQLVSILYSWEEKTSSFK